MSIAYNNYLINEWCIDWLHQWGFPLNMYATNKHMYCTYTSSTNTYYHVMYTWVVRVCCVYIVIICYTFTLGVIIHLPPPHRQCYWYPHKLHRKLIFWHHLYAHVFIFCCFVVYIKAATVFHVHIVYWTFLGNITTSHVRLGTRANIINCQRTKIFVNVCFCVCT